MFPKEKKIPTILGILIIALGIGATTYLTGNLPPLFTRARPEIAPQEVKITNVSEDGFAVSWVTQEEVTGSIDSGEGESLGKVTLDDRDQVAGQLGKYLTHHVSLKYLQPQTTYFFKIISEKTTHDNNGDFFKVSTAPKISSPSPGLEPIYGIVTLTNGSPAEGAVVYLNLTGAVPLSTLVKTSGSWLISLSSARREDLATYLTQKGEGEQIFVQGGKGETSQVTTNPQNDSPVPAITLGKNYDFRQGARALPTSTPTSPPLPTITGAPTPTLKPSFAGLTNGLTAIPSFSLVQPATGAAIAGQPIFRGTGAPGKTMTIEVQSPTLTGTATVDKNGNWSWTPPQDLSPGEHTVTVSFSDEKGIWQKITRKFTVLASGSGVTESATPSATPTLKPTPTIATATPTPATVSPPPVTADLTWTFLFLTGGIFFVILGLIVLKPTLWIK